MNKHDIDDLTDAFAGVIRAYGDVAKVLNGISDRLPQADHGYTCVRCNAHKSVESDGPPYVYCHGCSGLSGTGTPPHGWPSVEEAGDAYYAAYAPAMKDRDLTPDGWRTAGIRAVLALCASRAGAVPRDDCAAIFSAIETEFTLIWEREHGPVVKSCPVARVILREAFKRLDDAARERLTTAPGAARKGE